MPEADVFAIAEQAGQFCIEAFFFRTYQNWGNRAYFPRADRTLDAAEVLDSFLAQFYLERPAPRLVLLSHEVASRESLCQILSARAGHRIAIGAPRRGEKKELVDNALRNAREALSRQLAEAASQAKLLEALAAAFGLDEDAAPGRGLRQLAHHGDQRDRRDDRRRAGRLREEPVPHLQHQERGADAGRRLRDDARSADPPLRPARQGGGAASSRAAVAQLFPHPEERPSFPHPEEPPEAASRRTREGEIAAASSSSSFDSPALRAAQDEEQSASRAAQDEEDRHATPSPTSPIWSSSTAGAVSSRRRGRCSPSSASKGVALASIAKGPDRNAGRETFFIPGREPFKLSPRDPALFFVQRLRDEAHRFAIGTHRARRKKDFVKSPLDEIPGIGPSRKRALLHAFGSAKDVAKAGLADLEKTPGLNAATARRIYDFFHEGGGR